MTSPQLRCTPFQEWFSTSQVLSEHGKPAVMYHGARRMFDQFDFDQGRYSNAKMKGLGNWFSESAAVASLFATFTEAGDTPVVIPVFVRLLNPLVLETYSNLLERMGRSNGKSFRRTLLANGYDGIMILRSETEFMPARIDVVTFSADQSQSAIGNLVATA